MQVPILAIAQIRPRHQPDSPRELAGYSPLASGPKHQLRELHLRNVIDATQIETNGIDVRKPRAGCRGITLNCIGDQQSWERPFWIVLYCPNVGRGAMKANDRLRTQDER
jgi:hypothetical protein